MISIILPTLNEATALPPLLRALRDQAREAEIIVADGGSTDDTIAVAERHGVQVLRTTRGRGQQLADGGEAAHGDILLFLHADCRFPPNGLLRIEQILSRDAAIIGGNFRLLFDGGDRFSTWLNGFYQWIRRHGFYYGDSAVFVRRNIYRALGGIRPIALMEDYDFNRRMERFGQTCCIDDPPMVTSSRRFAGRHPAAIVWGWIKIHLMFHLGVSPDTLAQIYDSERRRNAGAALREP